MQDMGVTLERYLPRFVGSAPLLALETAETLQRLLGRPKWDQVILTEVILVLLNEFQQWIGEISRCP